MKAMVYTKAGPLNEVIQLKDIPTPTPKNNEVLVEVKASTLNILDYQRFASDKITLSTKFMDTAQKSVGKPLGGEISGIIAAVGKDVHDLKKGDEVYGKTMGLAPTGGWAEYTVLDENHVCLKPTTLSFEEAAAIPVSCETALGAIRNANIKSGQDVMIYGASGGVGQYAVQLAKAAGAVVTGVCSTRNLEMARSIGADYVIDYKRDDFRKVGKKFDAIIGINGKNPVNEYKRLLKPNGVYSVVGNTMAGFAGMGASLFNIFSSKKVKFFMAPLMPIKGYLPYIKGLVEDGKIKPFVDKVYPVQNVTKAISYTIKEHAQGKVVLDVNFEK